MLVLSASLARDSHVLFHTCEASLLPRTPSGAWSTRPRKGSFDFVWPALRAGHTPLRVTALLRSASGSCRGRFLWRPLRTMLCLVRGFVSAIILYHDIHQLLLGVDVAFHAFTRQLCQW